MGLLRARYRREKRLLDAELERDLLAVEVMEQSGEYEGRAPWLTAEDDRNRAWRRFEVDDERVEVNYRMEHRRLTQAIRREVERIRTSQMVDEEHLVTFYSTAGEEVTNLAGQV